MLFRHFHRRAANIGFFAGLMVLLMLITASVSPAGVVVQIVPPYFGDIDLHPRGDTITIAAQGGPATPSAEGSAVTGGGSGLLTLTSTEAEQAEVIYPDFVTLNSGGHSLTIRGMQMLSQTTANLPGGGARRDLSIGGSLNLRGDEKRGRYSGSMTIQINFF